MPVYINMQQSHIEIMDISRCFIVFCDLIINMLGLLVLVGTICGVYVQLANCLRVIRNAWHFHYALRLVLKVVCGGLGIALLTP